MIDWLTLKTSIQNLTHDTRHALTMLQGTIYKISPDGTCEWQVPARASVRSDSHQLQVQISEHFLTISGSPARLHSSDNVFGSSDPAECAANMLFHLSTVQQVELPPLEQFSCTRIDITHNYDLGSAANVRQALMVLRHAHGGRFQVKTTSESVYWSTHSQHRSGKAYHKGAHLEYLAKQGHDIDPEHIRLAQNLLRLELKLGHEFWRKQATKHFTQYTAAELNQLHHDYFINLIGKVEVTDMTDIKTNCINASKELGYTEGRGRAAYLYWLTIQSVGFQVANDSTPYNTRYKHLQILKQAGLSYSDFQAGRVVALRRTPLVIAAPVESWQQIAA